MQTNQAPKLLPKIVWMCRKHVPEVLAIEADSFEFPWLEGDFVRCLRQRNCIGMVAEDGNRVVGFMVYELLKTSIHLFNFVVAPEYRHRGVGRQMIEKLVTKLSPQRRNHIVLEVRETNLDAQLFFRANGFKAVSVLRDYYGDTPDDAYVMAYRLFPNQRICLGVNKPKACKV